MLPEVTVLKNTPMNAKCLRQIDQAEAWCSCMKKKGKVTRKLTLRCWLLSIHTLNIADLVDVKNAMIHGNFMQQCEHVSAEQKKV